MKQNKAMTKYMLSATVISIMALTGCKQTLDTLDAKLNALVSSVPSDGKMLDQVGAPAEPLSDNDKELEYRRVMVQAKGIAPMPSVTTLAQTVLDRIIDNVPYPDAPRATVHIIPNMSPGARAHASGGIFLHHSAFNYLNNEDQLAFLLAHEYAHIYLQHNPSSFIDKIRPYLMTAIDAYMATSDDEDDVQKGLRLYGSDMLVKNLLLPAWDRKLEAQADFLGIDLMVAAGYNPDEVVRFLHVLKTYEDSFEFLSTRKRNLLEQAITSQLSADNEGDAMMRNIMNEIKQSFSELLRDMNRTHLTASERVKDLYPYILREHEEATFRPLNVDSFATAVLDDDDILESYDLAYFVNNPSEDDNETRLFATARKSVSGRTKDHPYTRDSFAELRARTGNVDLALKNLELSQNQNGFLPFVMEVKRAEWLAKSGKPSEALARLEPVAIYYDWPLDSYRVMIPLAKNTSNERFKATELLLQCVAKYPQDRKVCGSST